MYPGYRCERCDREWNGPFYVLDLSDPRYAPSGRFCGLHLVICELCAEALLPVLQQPVTEREKEQAADSLVRCVLADGKQRGANERTSLHRIAKRLLDCGAIVMGRRR